MGSHVALTKRNAPDRDRSDKRPDRIAFATTDKDRLDFFATLRSSPLKTGCWSEWPPMTVTRGDKECRGYRLVHGILSGPNRARLALSAASFRATARILSQDLNRRSRLRDRSIQISTRYAASRKAVAQQLIEKPREYRGVNYTTKGAIRTRLRVHFEPRKRRGFPPKTCGCRGATCTIFRAPRGAP